MTVHPPPPRQDEPWDAAVPVEHVSSAPRLDIIIVNWNSGARLDRCLASLASASRTGLTLDRVVIVDNASDAFERPAPSPALPLTIIENASNEGFAVACTQGARGSRADYLLFLNPDTHVDKEALTVAVGALESPAHQRTAIVGLPLVDERGDRQATCGRFLTLTGVFNQLTGLCLAAPSRFRGIRMLEWDHGETRAVDYVSGACLLVRRDVFEALGGFDTRFTVYLEDADLSLRARREGWLTWFLADPAVYHEGGWQTGAARSLRLAHAWRSLLAYGAAHFNVAGACAMAALVLTLAPAARGMQAIVHGSPYELREALTAYARLWGMLGRDLESAARRRSRPVPPSRARSSRGADVQPHTGAAAPGARSAAGAADEDAAAAGL
jgi:N-acetylglucosaminyl-diphospho-decaprenol L-rhamnosyltransferase